MKDLLLGQEPAFPFFKENENGYGDTIVVYDQFGAKAFYPFEKGMNKRFYAACAAMQGLLSDTNNHTVPFSKIAEDSLLMADELLKQEQNETNN